MKFKINHFLKIILEIGGWDISYEIALTWISLYLTDDKSTLVQVMTWCPQTASHYLRKCRPRFMSTYGVTRPHWVNKLLLFSQHCFLSHFTPQYPQLTCLSTQPLYSHYHICFLCHLLIFHNKKKKHLNLLSSITKPLLTHTLSSFCDYPSQCQWGITAAHGYSDHTNLTHLPWTIWSSFCTWYFQMHFHEWNVLCFDWNFTEVCS